MSKSINGVRIEASEQKIYITNAFSRKASIIDSNEYSIIIQLMRDFTGFSFKEEGRLVSKTKQTYKGLDYDRMRFYVANVAGMDLSEREKAQKLKALEDIIVKARAYNGSGSHVKRWFLKAYPEYKGGFLSNENEYEEAE